jgi:radical SAM protein with 4Fe4S-binding SPASM domain
LELEEFKINQAGVNLINCGAGYRFFSISPDFKLYPCLMIDVPFGDAKNKSFIDYQNLYKKYSQINSPNRDICENCDLLLKCERCISEGLFNKNKVEYCRWYAKNKYFLKEIL